MKTIRDKFEEALRAGNEDAIKLALAIFSRQTVGSTTDFEFEFIVEICNPGMLDREPKAKKRK